MPPKEETVHTSIDAVVPSEPTSRPIRNTEELQYLFLVKDILQRGEHRPDRYNTLDIISFMLPLLTRPSLFRTGTGTYAIFAPPQLRFSLRDGALPLLTTKRVFTKAILAELLWFIAGSTDSKLLSAKGVKIWDGNGSREYLDSVGLSHRAVGDLGPVYGFQWRHFGANYIDCNTDYTGQGVDQLMEVVDKLMNKPYDRRIILSAWNPADMKKMALPPCHMFAQFYVSYPASRTSNATLTSTLTPHPTSPPSTTAAPQVPAPTASAKIDITNTRGELHCCLYQRSCDIGLGVPFNIASYAMLTHILAHVTGLDPGEFIHCMGDTHIYADHVEALQVQCEREPRAFPKIKINRPDLKGKGVVDGFKAEDFEVLGYDPWPAIKMKMSV